IEITVRVCPPISPVEYHKMLQENRDTARAIDEFEQTKLRHLRTMKPSDHKDRSSYYYPESPVDKALVAEFRDFIKSLPTHQLPNYYTDDSSIYVGTSLPDLHALYEREQEAECIKVWKITVSLFQPYPDPECPFRFWSDLPNQQ